MFSQKILFIKFREKENIELLITWLYVYLIKTYKFIKM